MKQNDRKWYSKKRYIIPLSLGAIVLGLSSLASSPVPTTVPAEQPAAVVQSFTSHEAIKQTVPIQSAPVQTNTAVLQVSPSPSVNVPAQTPESAALSNDNYYQNSAGATVHSPAYSRSVPAGTTAQCGDGTYSFSQSRRGTCSHHGGVAEWNP